MWSSQRRPSYRWTLQKYLQQVFFCGTLWWLIAENLFLTRKLIPEVVCCFQKFPGFCSDQTKILLGRWRCCTKMVVITADKAAGLYSVSRSFLLPRHFEEKPWPLSQTSNLCCLCRQRTALLLLMLLLLLALLPMMLMLRLIRSSPCWWSYFFAPTADVESLPNWNVDNSSNPPLLLIWRKKLPAEELWLLVLMISCFLHWTVGQLWLWLGYVDYHTTMIENDNDEDSWARWWCQQFEEDYKEPNSFPMSSSTLPSGW